MENKNAISFKIKRCIYTLTKKQNRRSAIWDIFAEIRKPDGSIVNGFVSCCKCLNVFKYNGKTSSNLNCHKCYSSLRPARQQNKNIQAEDSNENKPTAADTAKQPDNTTGSLNVKQEVNAEDLTVNAKPDQLSIRRYSDLAARLETAPSANVPTVVPTFRFNCMCGCPFYSAVDLTNLQVSLESDQYTPQTQ